MILFRISAEDYTFRTYLSVTKVENIQSNQIFLMYLSVIMAKIIQSQHIFLACVPVAYLSLEKNNCRFSVTWEKIWLGRHRFFFLACEIQKCDLDQTGIWFIWVQPLLHYIYYLKYYGIKIPGPIIEKLLTASVAAFCTCTSRDLSSSTRGRAMGIVNGDDTENRAKIWNNIQKGIYCKTKCVLFVTNCLRGVMVSLLAMFAEGLYSISVWVNLKTWKLVFLLLPKDKTGWPWVKIMCLVACLPVDCCCRELSGKKSGSAF